MSCFQKGAKLMRKSRFAMPLWKKLFFSNLISSTPSFKPNSRKSAGQVWHHSYCYQTTVEWYWQMQCMVCKASSMKLEVSLPAAMNSVQRFCQNIRKMNRRFNRSYYKVSTFWRDDRVICYEFLRQHWNGHHINNTSYLKTV